MTRLTFYVNSAAMIFDDALTYRKAQS